MIYISRVACFIIKLKPINTNYSYLITFYLTFKQDDSEFLNMEFKNNHLYIVFRFNM